MIEENLRQVILNIHKKREVFFKKHRQNFSHIEPVTLIAVTKNHGVAEMRQAIDQNVIDIGENLLQEALTKKEELQRDVRWHLIGHLQTNKVQKALQIFDLIHSVDSERLLLAIDKYAQKIEKCQDILLQVNIAKEKTKFGIHKEELFTLVELTEKLSSVRLCGLMMIAPNFSDVEKTRPFFQEMYKIFQKLQDLSIKKANIKYLSMGMTNDYQIALEEGANMVRIGTAIFGERHYGG